MDQVRLWLLAPSTRRYASVAFVWLLLAFLGIFLGVAVFSGLLGRLDRTGDLALALSVVGVAALAFVFAVQLRRGRVVEKPWVAIGIGSLPFAWVAILCGWDLLFSQPPTGAGKFELMLDYEAQAYALAAFWVGLGVAVGAPLAALLAGIRKPPAGGI